jgi:hypothetical protein
MLIVEIGAGSSAVRLEALAAERQRVRTTFAICNPAARLGVDRLIAEPVWTLMKGELGPAEADRLSIARRQPGGSGMPAIRTGAGTDTAGGDAH